MSEAEAPARPPLPALALLAAWVVLAAMAFRTIAGTDPWLHLAGARAVAEHGVGGADAFTQFSAGKSWVQSTWLYDVVVARLHALGAGAVTLPHLAALVGTFVLLARTSRAWAGTNAAAFATLLCGWTLASRLDARPELVAMLLPALLFWRLERHQAGWLLLAWALPLQVLWANLHPSFIIAPLMALAYAAEAWIDARQNPAARARALPLSAAVAGLVLVPLLNPQFGRVYSGAAAWLLEDIPVAARLWSTPYLAPYIEQFTAKAPGLLGNPVNWLLGLGALGLVVYKKRLPIARTALAILGALLVVNSFDHAAEIFVVLVFPFLCLSLQSLGNVGEELAAGASAGRRPSLAPLASGAVLTLAAVTLLSFVSNAWYVRKGMPCSFGLGVEKGLLPTEAVAVIERPDFPSAFVNLPLDGGYLAWKLRDRKVFIDQRLALHGPAAYQDLMDALLGRSEEAAQRLFKEGQPEAVVLNCGAYQATELAGRLMAGGSWAPVYLDGATLILVARKPAYDALIRDTELQARGLALIEEERQAYAARLGGWRAAPIPPRLIGAAGMLLARGQIEEALSLYHLLQAGAPTMVNAWLQKGACLLRLDKRDLAVTTLRKAVEMSPRDPGAWGLFAQALDAAGKKVEAKDALERAKALTPKSEKKAETPS
jgi:hypothetical protein